MTAKNPVARLAIAWCTLFVVGTDLFVVSPLLPLIAGDYNLSPTTAGLTVTAFAVTYMICAPLLGRILEGSPQVLDLFETNPFPDQPPRYVRASFYDYVFTSPSERRETGAWWKRTNKGLYFPAYGRDGPLER